MADSNFYIPQDVKVTIASDFISFTGTVIYKTERLV